MKTKIAWFLAQTPEKCYRLCVNSCNVFCVLLLWTRFSSLASLCHIYRERTQNNRHTDITISQSLKVDSQWIFHVYIFLCQYLRTVKFFVWQHLFLSIAIIWQNRKKTFSKYHNKKKCSCDWSTFCRRFLFLSEKMWNETFSLWADSFLSHPNIILFDCYRITVHLYHLLEIIQLWTLFWKQVKATRARSNNEHCACQSNN